MPDRVIRDELLRSKRFWSVEPQAGLLFVAVALSADDAARFTADPFTLALAMGGTVTQERVLELLEQCFAVDLLRRYSVAGVQYLFVPRFGQRKRYVKSSRYPAPPKNIENNTLDTQSQTQVGPKSDSGQTQVGPETRGVGVGVGVGEVLERGRGEEGSPMVRLRDMTAGREGLAKVADAIALQNLKVKPVLKNIPQPEPEDNPTPAQVEAMESERRRQLAILKAKE